MVFPQIERNSLEFSRISEPMYKYLSRSSRLEAKYIRNIVDIWFSHYPIHAQKELLANLQTLNDQQFLSAFFELYLHEMLLKMAFEIKIHPTLENDILKTPDFFVKDDVNEFYLEAKLSTVLSIDEIKGKKRLEDILNEINKIYCENFFVHVKIDGYPNSSVSIKRLRIVIIRWLEALNYEEIVRLENEYSKQIDLNIQLEGCNLVLSPKPNKTREKGKTLIYSESHSFSLLKTKETIRKAIHKKNSRYGKFEKPYILAINVLSPVCDYEDVFEALFGSDQCVFDPNKPDDEPPRNIRARDGKWKKDFNTRLSGVFIIKTLNPWTFTQKDMTLYLNPWARYPYRGKLLDFPHFSPDHGVMEYVDGIKPSQLLGLSRNWSGK